MSVGVVCLVTPEHEGDGGEEGDDSTKCDVAPGCGRQSWAVQKDVQTVQKVPNLRKGMEVGGGGNGKNIESSYLGGAEVDEDRERVGVEEKGNLERIILRQTREQKIRLPCAEDGGTYHKELDGLKPE